MARTNWSQIDMEIYKAERIITTIVLVLFSLVGASLIFVGIFVPSVSGEPQREGIWLGLLAISVGIAIFKIPRLFWSLCHRKGDT